MKTTRLLSVLFAVLFGAATLAVSAAPAETPYCSLETVMGSYAYSIQGYRNGKPYASSGLFSFDGKGQVAVVYTSSIERKQLVVSGNYIVNSDCTGTMTLAITTVNNFYLSPDGDGFHFVRVSSDDVIGTEAKWVSDEMLVKQP